MQPDMQLAARRIEPEWLDELPPSDPRALRSRADLRRVNAVMLQAGAMARLLKRASPGPAGIIDIGAGDGHFLLRVARRLGPAWSGSHAVLLDRQPSVSPTVLDGFRALGWTPSVEAGDILTWAGTLRAGTPGNAKATIACANLVLHHFDDAALAALFAGLAGAGVALAAVEPARSRLALAGCRLLPLIGCGDVTLHDAAASVRAGFAGEDLSRLWRSAAADAPWTISEKRVGPFSHGFVAVPEGRTHG
jgi:hypothetical protein